MEEDNGEAIDGSIQVTETRMEEESFFYLPHAYVDIREWIHVAYC